LISYRIIFPTPQNIRLAALLKLQIQAGWRYGGRPETSLDFYADALARALAGHSMIENQELIGILSRLQRLFRG
jgi:hypothetical protein